MVDRPVTAAPLRPTFASDRSLPQAMPESFDHVVSRVTAHTANPTVMAILGDVIFLAGLV